MHVVLKLGMGMQIVAPGGDFILQVRDAIDDWHGFPPCWKSGRVAHSSRMPVPAVHRASCGRMLPCRCLLLCLQPCIAGGDTADYVAAGGCAVLKPTSYAVRSLPRHRSAGRRGVVLRWRKSKFNRLRLARSADAAQQRTTLASDEGRRCWIPACAIISYALSPASSRAFRGRATASLKGRCALR